MNRRLTLTAALSACLLATAALIAQSASPQQAVDAAFAKFKNLQEGKNADYIPALAKVDPKLFGIAQQNIRNLNKHFTRSARGGAFNAPRH